MDILILCLNNRGPPKHQKEADNVSVTTQIVEIPDFQSVEGLLDFLLSEFMFMWTMGGMLVLTNDDLRVLADTLQRFTDSSARSENQTTTDNYEEE